MIIYYKRDYYKHLFGMQNYSRQGTNCTNEVEYK